MIFHKLLQTRNIFQAIPDALILTNEKGLIQQINLRATELFGYEEKDLLGESITKLFPIDAAAVHLIGLDELIKDGSTRDKFVTMRTKNGVEILTILYCRMIKDGIRGQMMLFAVDDRRVMQEYVAERLSEVIPILQKVAIGDFSENIKVPKNEDEFTELFVALSLMIDDITELERNREEAERAKIAAAAVVEKSKRELAEKMARELEVKVKERTAELQDAVQHLAASEQQQKAANQQLNAVNQQLAASQKNLHDKLLELERFNKVAVGRELKMVELKKEIDRLNSINNKTN